MIEVEGVMRFEVVKGWSLPKSFHDLFALFAYSRLRAVAGRAGLG